ncbi:MAG: T9SS type A sorting domain-containing protein [Melioribacter sp.]|nr:T9SS type A sorting domain-containing protein [Melioribacter sp.]
MPSFPVGDGSNNPSYVDIPLGEGEHSIEFIWYGYDYGQSRWFIADVKTRAHTVKFYVYVSNIFGGGNVYVDNIQRSSGFSKTVFSGNTIDVGAIEQNYNGYYWMWSTSGSYPSKWVRQKGVETLISYSQFTTYNVGSADNSASIVAGLRKVCSLTFQANSSMTINGNYRTSPYTESVVEQNTISALASSYSANGIDFTFSKWSTSSGDVYSPITASEHKTYAAVYTGKPNNNYRSMSFNNSQEGQPVQITWAKHPLDNSSISHYAIWRKVTTSGTPTLLTTVNANGSGSYTYTDYDYAISSGVNKILLFYDVRPYYSPDNSYSDPSFEGVYGIYNTNQLPGEMAQNQTSLEELPTSLSVNNYPNPFNPTTTISYQLPEKSFVTLKVFDILGKEVETLVNENKSAGYHTVIFDAGHSERGRGMTSGVYIYTISANGIVQTKKMLLTK